MNTRGSQSAEGAPGATEAAKFPKAKACREMVADCSAIVFCCASTKASRRETVEQELSAHSHGAASDSIFFSVLFKISPSPVNSQLIFNSGYAKAIL